MSKKFRADHYILAQFESVPDIMGTGQKILSALREMPEMKDLAIMSIKREGRQWAEISGRIDIPVGSRAFWAMIKREVTPKEPYHLYIRIDINAEGTTIEEARANAKRWIESQFVPRIRAHTNVTSIKVLQPDEIAIPRLE